MKKFNIILSIALMLFCFKPASADDNKRLESPSLKITDLVEDVTGYVDDFNNEATKALYVKFVLTNKTSDSVDVKAIITKKYMNKQHIAFCCLGACIMMDSSSNYVSPEGGLSPNQSTDPNGTSYISIEPQGVADKDTLDMAIYVIDSEGTPDYTDFVAFVATWDFEAGGSVNLNVLPKATAFPNPATNTLMLNTDITGCENVEIYDITGNLVLSQDLRTNDMTVNTESLNAGPYIGYLVKAGAKLSAFTFVKQ